MPAGAVVVEVSGIKNDKGVAQAGLFRASKGFPHDYDAAARVRTAPVVKGKCTVTFKDLEDGNYAVGVFHDINMNHAMDRRPPGKEMWGASDVRKRRSSAPKFKDACVAIAGKPVTVKVTVEF